MAGTVKDVREFEDYLFQLSTSKYEKVIAEMVQTEICPNCKSKMTVKEDEEQEEKGVIIMECPTCDFCWGD